MFIVTLRFGEQKQKAASLMAAHNAWIARGFEDGVFLLVGSLRPAGGGAVLAHGTSLEALQQRVVDDPFVAEGVVHAEVVEVAVGKVDPRLQFLAAPAVD